MKHLSTCLLFPLLLGILGCGGGDSEVASKKSAGSPSPTEASASSDSANDEASADSDDSETEPDEGNEESSSEPSPQENQYYSEEETDPDAAYEEQMMQSENSYSEEEGYQNEQSYDEEMAEAMANNEDGSYESEDFESQMSSRMANGSGGPSPFGGAFSPQAAAPEPLPQDYLSRAKRAFKDGMEAEAHNLLMAHLIAEYENASGTYSLAGWSGLLKKPVWALKIGIGVNNGAVKHSGDYHPVRAGMKAPIDKDGGGAFSSNGGDPNQEVERFVGLAVEVTKRMFDEKFVAGDFGEIFSKEGTGVGEIEQSPTGNSRGGDFVSASNEFERLSERETETSGGEFESSSFDERDPSSNSSPEAFGMEMGDFGGGGGQGVGGLPLFQSGLGYLGTGRAPELLEKAKAAGLDAYLQFDVSIKQNPKNKAVYNDCSLRLMSVATGKPIGRSSGKIKNIEIYQAMQSRDINPMSRVSEALSGVFNSAFNQLRLDPLPQLTEQQVRSRVGSFIVNPPKNPLDALAEIRLYQSKGLISEDEVFLAFDLLLGDEGLVLAAGPLEMQQELIDEKLPSVAPAL